MRSKSFWAMLIVAMLVASFAFLHATPMASASPAHVAAHQAAAHPNAPHVIPGCSAGQKLLVQLGIFGPSVFGNYHATCVNTSPCAVGAPPPIYMVCLYEHSNYGGKEIDFVGNGCANLTAFAGPGADGTWNDAMSSFRIMSGTSTYGAFWWNTNDSLYYYLFGPPGSGRVSATSYIGNTWNDQASSLQIDPNPGGC